MRDASAAPPGRLSRGGVQTAASRDVKILNYLLKEGRLLRCVRCGYLFGEVEEAGELHALHVKFLLLITKPPKARIKVIKQSFFTAMEGISGTVPTLGV
jgi:hypothetical protein